MNEYKLLQYVGKKPSKPDTVARTGILWTRPGDIKAVPMPQADILLRHPDVWREVDREGRPTDTPLIQQGEPDAPSLVQQAQQDQGIAAQPGDELPPAADPAIEAIKAAIATLDRESDEHFSSAGKPRIAAVREALTDAEMVINTEQLATAWDALQGEAE